jgi:hypothetical protein
VSEIYEKWRESGEDAGTVVEWEREYRHGAIQVQAQTDRSRYRLDTGKRGLRVAGRVVWLKRAIEWGPPSR